MIQPDGIPIAALKNVVDALEANVQPLSDLGPQITTLGQTVHRTFQGLNGCYEAPERDILTNSTLRIQTNFDKFGPSLPAMAVHLRNLAGEVHSRLNTLETIRRDAYAWLKQKDANPDWQEDEGMVNKNNQMVNDVHRIIKEELPDLCFRCANAIVALHQGKPWDPKTGLREGEQPKEQAKQEGDPPPEPWGTTEELDKPWYEDCLDFAGNVLVGIVTCIGETVQGILTLIPVLPALGSIGFLRDWAKSTFNWDMPTWESAGAAWKGLAGLAANLVAAPVQLAWWGFDQVTGQDTRPQFVKDLGEQGVEMLKGLVAWDEWSKNPGKALGMLLTNVVTTAASFGAGAAVKGAALAGKFGVASAAVVKVANVVDKVGALKAGMHDAALGAVTKIPKVGSVVEGMAKIPIVGHNFKPWKVDTPSVPVGEVPHVGETPHIGESPTSHAPSVDSPHVDSPHVEAPSTTHDPGLSPTTHDPGVSPTTHDPGTAPTTHDPGTPTTHAPTTHEPGTPTTYEPAAAPTHTPQPETLTNTPSSHTPASHTPSTHTPETQLPETPTPQTHVPESRVPQTHTAETQASQTHTPQTHVPESRTPETPETHTPETRTPQTHTPETHVPESRTPETHTPETHVPESRTPQTHVPESRTAETRTPQTHTPETHTPETHVPESRTPQTHAPETHTPETRVPEQRGAEVPGQRAGEPPVVAPPPMMPMHPGVHANEPHVPSPRAPEPAGRFAPQGRTEVPPGRRVPEGERPRTNPEEPDYTDPTRTGEHAPSQADPTPSWHQRNPNEPAWHDPNHDPARPPAHDPRTVDHTGNPEHEFGPTGHRPGQPHPGDEPRMRETEATTDPRTQPHHVRDEPPAREAEPRNDPRTQPRDGGDGPRPRDGGNDPRYDDPRTRQELIDQLKPEYLRPAPGKVRSEVDPFSHLRPDPMDPRRVELRDSVGPRPHENPENWVHKVNPDHVPGGHHDWNCADTARAACEILNGDEPRLAAGRTFKAGATMDETLEWMGLEDVPEAYKFARPADRPGGLDLDQEAFQKVRDALHGRPPGTHANVGMHFVDGGGHRLTAFVDKNGELKWLDAQKSHAARQHPDGSPEQKAAIERDLVRHADEVPVANHIDRLEFSVREPGGQWEGIPRRAETAPASQRRFGQTEEGNTPDWARRLNPEDPSTPTPARQHPPEPPAAQETASIWDRLNPTHHEPLHTPEPTHTPESTHTPEPTHSPEPATPEWPREHAPDEQPAAHQPSDRPSESADPLRTSEPATPEWPRERAPEEQPAAHHPSEPRVEREPRVDPEATQRIPRDVIRDADATQRIPRDVIRDADHAPRTPEPPRQPQHRRDPQQPHQQPRYEHPQQPGYRPGEQPPRRPEYDPQRPPEQPYRQQPRQEQPQYRPEQPRPRQEQPQFRQEPPREPYQQPRPPEHGQQPPHERPQHPGHRPGEQPPRRPEYDPQRPPEQPYRQQPRQEQPQYRPEQPRPRQEQPQFRQEPPRRAEYERRPSEHQPYREPERAGQEPVRPREAGAVPRRSRSELGVGRADAVRKFTHEIGDPEYRVAREVERDFQDTLKSGRHQKRLLDEWRRDLPDGNELSDPELLAIDRVADAHRQMDINDALKHHDEPALADLELEIRTAASGINKLPDFHGPVRRGEYVEGAELEKVLDRYQPGRNVPERGFTEWSKTYEPGGNVQFHLNSRHGKDISFGTHRDRVVHGPENHVRVERRWFDKETDTWHIELSDHGRVPGLKNVEVPQRAAEAVSNFLRRFDEAGGEVRVLDPKHDGDLLRDLKEQARTIAQRESKNPTVNRGRKYLEQVFDDASGAGERRIAVSLRDGKLLAAADFAFDDNNLYMRLLGTAHDTAAGRGAPGAGIAAAHAALRTAREKGLPIDGFANDNAKTLYRIVGARMEQHGGSAHLPAADVRWLVDEADHLRGATPTATPAPQ
ncbi:toxin glutamine deamidase domain-containing protein [Kribbella sp. NPDC026611]|uniref:toxin glutamine deamidase domain-containing protein n=1 Tax=Kribbella sp. NPDC026611 TaxID=3154911 RepID=UPI0033EAE0C5